ncbi:MAG: hypothetical protein R2730_13010 [Chitinophagales bacterium]
MIERKNKFRVYFLIAVSLILFLNSKQSLGQNTPNYPEVIANVYDLGSTNIVVRYGPGLSYSQITKLSPQRALVSTGEQRTPNPGSPDLPWFNVDLPTNSNRSSPDEGWVSNYSEPDCSNDYLKS